MTLHRFSSPRSRILNCLLALSVTTWTGCNSKPSNSELRVKDASGSPSVSSEKSTTGGKQVSVAFVTNQIADFWRIAEAGCKDAEKDFGVSVQVRMPAQATAVEQKRVVEDLITSGVAAIAISPLDSDNQIEWLNEIAAKVPSSRTIPTPRNRIGSSTSAWITMRPEGLAVSW